MGGDHEGGGDEGVVLFCEILCSKICRMPFLDGMELSSVHEVVIVRVDVIYSHDAIFFFPS